FPSCAGYTSSLVSPQLNHDSSVDCQFQFSYNTDWIFSIVIQAGDHSVGDMIARSGGQWSSTMFRIGARRAPFSLHLSVVDLNLSSDGPNYLFYLAVDNLTLVNCSPL